MLRSLRYFTLLYIRRKHKTTQHRHTPFLMTEIQVYRIVSICLFLLFFVIAVFSANREQRLCLVKRTAAHSICKSDCSPDIASHLAFRQSYITMSIYPSLSLSSSVHTLYLCFTEYIPFGWANTAVNRCTYLCVCFRSLNDESTL